MSTKVMLYNTLSQKKEELVPYSQNKIKMYVCGPTVYSSAHLGHARAAVTFDVIERFLSHIGYEVTYVRNFTDIDDKIISKANETGVPTQEISEKYIQEYKEDMASIGVKSPTIQPKVTEHVPEIVEMIERIIDNGHAYQSGDDVFFSVKKFKGYGKLSRRDPDDMLAGARIDINEKKEDPLDFALWKGAKPGEPFWESPWGNGRPGWHIECSLMSTKYLGESFDIHGGGKDLIFPHHENEIAQSEAATGKPFAKYWIHNGLIQINREKMSKSIGNILNVREAVSMWSNEAIRLFFLSHQYLNPADFSDTTMNEAEAALERLYITLKRANDLRKDGEGEDKQLANSVQTFKERWVKTMCDDFNTADALGSLFELTRAINRSLDSIGWTPTLQSALEEINHFGSTLGVLEYEPEEYLQGHKLEKSSSDITEEEIEELIKERNSARDKKNWKRADEIRDDLSNRGILLEDKAEDTIWRVKS
ncbi:MAG: cysteine--tRNA ligase [Candidatus Dadabacteria bacterium]|nr:MAG: cysteine--tRNA ligase [Candidatus Dadabacteria bacterium]TDJ00744.1 MAG: cysteine--tRNA ligase [Candidatus Dadabacteria bacterium]